MALETIINDALPVAVLITSRCESRTVVDEREGLLMETSNKTIKGTSDDALAKPLLRDIAYDRLKEAIQTGELRPGEPLYEVRLSKRLDISRTPIREALQQLVREGLVRSLPNRAMTVAQLSMEEVLNVLHIRSLVEPEITRLAAASASKEMLDVLWQAIEDLEAAAEDDNRADWSRADTVFHEALSAACPNALLGELGLQMRNRMHLVATDSQTTSERLKTCTHEHRKIVQAIADRDAEKAREAMSEHLLALRNSFFKRLSFG